MIMVMMIKQIELSTPGRRASWLMMMMMIMWVMMM